MDDTDRAFLRATYSDPAWPTICIAAKLDVPLPTIYAQARRMSLTAAPDIRTPRFDWQRARELIGAGVPFSEVAMTVGVTESAVRYAIKRMERMPEKHVAICLMRYARTREAGLLD
jgi:hypothetical protein